MKYIVLGLVWAAYGVFHSALLSHPVKDRLTRRDMIECHWRLFFAIVSTLTLIPPVWLTYVTDGPWLVVWPWKWLQFVINGAALFAGWIALQSFGGGLAFLGLDRLFGQCERPKPPAPIQTGILGWVRHPLYALSVVFLWAHDLNASGLVTSSVLTVYIFIGAWLEERRLMDEWGPAWSEYRREVPAFLPIKKIAQPLTGFFWK